MRYALIFLLSFLSLGVSANTQKVVLLSEIEQSHHLAKKSLIIEDQSSKINLQEVLSHFETKNNESLISPDSDVPYMDFTTSTFWMKLEVVNDLKSPKKFNIELARPLTNVIEFYVLDESKNLTYSEITGDDLVFSERPINYRKFIFPLTFPPNAKRTLLMKIKSDGEILKLPIKFWSDYTLSEFISKENFFLGCYYGFIILVVILFTFFGIALNQKIYFFFVSYVLLMGFFQFALDGFAYRYFWPNSPYWGNHSILVFAAVSMLSLLIYANQFLELCQERKSFWLTYRIFFGLLLLCLATSLTNGILYIHTYPVLNGLSFIITFFFFIGIYSRYKSGKSFEIAVSLAFVFLWVGAIFFILSNVNIIESEFLATNSLKIASAIEITLLSISLAQRYRQTQNLKLKAEKDSVERLEQINTLKNEQTEFLEKQVKERTQEIVAQKDTLKEKNQEIIQSIVYAKRLQSAILPSRKTMESKFTEAHVFFRPKDIVSGDFYWVEYTKGYVFFAVADCTGHGVPGALVSVVGHNALGQCIKELKLTDTGEILDSLTSLVEHTFSSEDSTVSDGMDIALCRWDYKNESSCINLMFFLSNSPTLTIQNRK